MIDLIWFDDKKNKYNNNKPNGPRAQSLIDELWIIFVGYNSISFLYLQDFCYFQFEIFGKFPLLLTYMSIISNCSTIWWSLFRYFYLIHSGTKRHCNRIQTKPDLSQLTRWIGLRYSKFHGVIFVDNDHPSEDSKGATLLHLTMRHRTNRTKIFGYNWYNSSWNRRDMVFKPLISRISIICRFWYVCCMQYIYARPK